MGTNLIIIDPQNDFCKSGEQPIFDNAGRCLNLDKASGTLFVTGADKDMERLSGAISANWKHIDSINVTLDSHHFVHIAHPIWWVDSNGKHPPLFTEITVDDVMSGKWRSMNPGFQKRSEEYVKTLKANKRYALMIWPPHCLIGTKGHAIVDSLNDAIRTWEGQFAIANIVTKGSNMFTEHYSAVIAEVQDASDYTTKLNTTLIDLLLDTGNDDIVIAGEALSHCVANTIRDIATKFSTDQIKKFVLLTDACSNVTYCDKLGEDFLNEMTAKGMRLSTTTKYF